MFARLLIAGVLVPLIWGQALEEGKRAFDAQKYTVAERLFEKAHQESAACEILVYLGMARYRQQQVNNALIAFQEAVRCDSTLVLAHLALGEAYAAKGNDNEAIAAYESV
jgi:Tfp pilus assembly protein PilF